MTRRNQPEATLQRSVIQHLTWRARPGVFAFHVPNGGWRIAVELEHAGHHFRMQIGCFPDGALGEVCLDAAKQNSGLDAFAADAAILVSLLLQHGATPAEIGHALRRAPDGTAASLVGAVVDRLAEMGRPQS